MCEKVVFCQPDVSYAHDKRCHAATYTVVYLLNRDSIKAAHWQLF